MDLVTGATGFIGRRLTARLLAEGRRVRALVLPSEADRVAALGLGDVEIIQGDVTDLEAVKSAMQGTARIFHLAAVVGDWGDDALFQKVNVEGTRNVLETAAALRCERLVMVSSIVVYGRHLSAVACHETTPREYGVGPYSRTKRESEQLALDYHQRGRVPVTVVRPGNVYGPASGVWVDEIVSLMRARRFLLVDQGRGDAALAYVDNVVDVLVRAGAAECAAGRIYNANDGSGVTWRQYFADLAKIAGMPEPSRSVPAPMARVLAAGMERTWRLLGKSSRPLLTVEAVTLLTSQKPVPIARAVDELGYQPIAYNEAIENVARYIHGGRS